MVVTKNKRSKSFKVPASVTLSNSERLGSRLMQCIEYMELMGSDAVMEGAPEGEPCISTMIRKVTERLKSGKTADVTIKPGMYNGINDVIRNQIDNLPQDYDLLYFESAGLIDKLEIASGVSLVTPYDIYLRNGRTMSFTEALVRYFIKNEKVSPEQNYCSTSSQGGVTEYDEKYSCISDILDLSRSDRKWITDTTTDYKFDDDINVIYLDESVRPIVTIPEFIKLVNEGASCAVKNPIFDSYINQSRSHGSRIKVPCIEKVINDGMKTQSTGSGAFSHQMLSIYNPIVQVLDKYDFNAKVSGGASAMQHFINKCNYAVMNTENQYAVFHKSILEGFPSSRNMRNTYMELLSSEYDFKDYYVNSDGGSNFRVKSDGGTYVTTAIDYMLTTGIGSSSLAESTYFPSILNELPLCKYGDAYSTCIERVLYGLNYTYGGIEPLSDPTHIPDNLNYMVLGLALSRPDPSVVFTNAILNGTCVAGNGDYTTCMNLLMDGLELHPEERVYAAVANEISARNILLQDLTCTTTDKKSNTNCLDRLLNASNLSYPLKIIDQSDILLNRPDCKDAQGNIVTCIDKLYQRHELWNYLRYRARQLINIATGLVESRKYADAEHRVELDKRIGVVNQMIENVETASAKYRADNNPMFEVISKSYDIGSEKVHIPNIKDPMFITILEDDLSTPALTEGYEKPCRYFKETERDRYNYVREVLKTAKSGDAGRDYYAVSRIFKMYDANASLINTYNDYVGMGIPMLISSNRAEPTTFNMFECRDTNANKTISCMQKMIDVSRKMSEIRIIGGTSDAVYGNEMDGILSSKEIFKDGMCEFDVGGVGKKGSCLEYIFAKSNPREFTMGSYIAMLSNKDFIKYADRVVTSTTGKETTLRKLVCKNAPLFELAHYMITRRGAKVHTVKHNEGVTPRPRMDHIALQLHASVCKECDKIKDPVDRRMCHDSDCFEAFLADGYIKNTHTNEMGRPYGGFNPDYSGWANDFKNDPEAAMSHFRYQRSDDAFGLTGVYEITPKATSTDLTKSEEGDYIDMVEGVIFPAIKRSVGLTFKRYKEYSNAIITNVSLSYGDGGVNVSGDAFVTVNMKASDRDGKTVDIEERIPVSELFTRGGLLSGGDARNHVVKLKPIESAINKINTRKSAKSGGDGSGSIKLIISNRPADFIRSSTCQPWTSCMGFRSFPSGADGGGSNRTLVTKMGLGGYVVYAAADDLSPYWLARMFITPAAEKPGENDQMFKVDQAYGLPEYEPLMEAAVGIILREHGYNAPGAYDQHKHKGMRNSDYIFNIGNHDRSYPTRRGGQESAVGGMDGVRYYAFIKEIWEEATQKCLERVANGESFVARVGETSVPVTQGNDCEYFSIHGKVDDDIDSSQILGLISSGLIPNDYMRNYHHLLNYYYNYDGGTVKHNFDEIDDTRLKKFYDMVDVIKLRPIATKRKGVE